MPSVGDTAISVQVAEQAVQWWVALHAGDGAQETLPGLQRWREASPEHEAAWQRIETMGGQMASIPAPLVRAALDQPVSARRRRTVQLLSALVVSGGVAGVAGLVRTQHWNAWTADVATATGEHRRLRLPDGGEVVLNTASAINIHYTDQQRVLQLVRGEILIQTAVDASRRPFIVQTAAGRVRALGTQFLVREMQSSTLFDVGVLEGAVELIAHNFQEKVRIDAGQRGSLSPSQAQNIGQLPANASSWVNGMLVVSNMRLGDFLAEVARYRPGRLGCDPAVAHLLVSGTYPLADTERILTALTVSLPVHIQRFSRFWVTVQPRPAAAAQA